MDGILSPVFYKKSVTNRLTFAKVKPMDVVLITVEGLMHLSENLMRIVKLGSRR